MKQFCLFLSFIFMLTANALLAQNDSIYHWKSGVLILQKSIKPVDLDSITFTNPKTKVSIGTQVWATKNLNVTTYRDGTPIPQIFNASEWKNLTTGAWCYYANSTANGTIYGKLYNWYAVAGIHDNDPNTPNKILAPIGWHVPTDDEWSTLINYLDINADGGRDANDAGGKMKSTGTSLWTIPNSDATNSSGFTGLPGGARNDEGPFLDISLGGYWWSSSELDNTNAWVRMLYYKNVNVIRASGNKPLGCSVRCLRD